MVQITPNPESNPLALLQEHLLLQDAEQPFSAEAIEFILDKVWEGSELDSMEPKPLDLSLVPYTRDMLTQLSGVDALYEQNGKNDKRTDLLTRLAFGAITKLNEREKAVKNAR